MDSTWPASQIDPPIRPLTRDEAQALLERHPVFSLTTLFAVQVGVGVLVALVWWGSTGSQSAGLSALYGAAAALVPNALMARGVFGSKLGSTVAGLVFWELVKLVAAGAMMAFAPFLIKPLSWPAMLIAMLLCMKVVGVVMLLQSRPRKM